jgi:hypothetical protein
MDLSIYIQYTLIIRLVVHLSPRRPGFDIRPAHVRFVLNKVAQMMVYLRVIRSSPLIWFHNGPYPSSSARVSYQNKKWRCLENLKKQRSFGSREASTFTFLRVLKALTRLINSNSSTTALEWFCNQIILLLGEHCYGNLSE